MKAKELIAVDPGDAHTGVALFRRIGGETQDPTEAWECSHAYEAAGFEFAHELATMLAKPWGSPSPDIVVVERFQLYAHKANEQIGSEFETVQLIGAIRGFVEHNNAKARNLAWDPTELYDPTNFTGRKAVELVMQQAAIKRGTRAWLRQRKLTSAAKLLKAGGHAFDAELHGWHFLAKQYDLI